MTDKPEASYEFVCSQYHLDVLKRLGQTAAQLGIANEYLTAVAMIHEKLTTAPLTWGDPLFKLHNLDLLVCRGKYSMVNVHYAVDEKHRMVFIREFQALPGSELAVDP